MAMFADWQPQHELNLFRLGDAAMIEDLPEEGVFEVRYNGNTKSFTDAVAAWKFYLRLTEPAEFYEVTEGKYVLLERKIVLTHTHR